MKSLVRAQVNGWTAATCAALALVACGGSGGTGGETGAGQGGSSGTKDASTAAGIGGGLLATSSGSAGASAPTGGPSAEACKHIDVVIAVDDSGSMKEERDAIAKDVFPAFAKELLAVSGGIEDFRVGVVPACPLPADFLTRADGGKDCEFASGKPWMDSSSPALVSEFACVGDIDSSGVKCTGDNDDEQPASSAAAALEQAAAGGPNAGFLRDEALLVVIAITDEDEQPVPQASAKAVFDRLVTIKGDVRRMIFLGIGGAKACEGTYGAAKDASKLREITALFSAEKRGVFRDLCAGQLEEGLAEVLQVIEAACNELPSLPPPPK